MKLSREIQDSIELRFSTLARQMNGRGERIISFGLGEPDFPTPPAVVEAATKAMRQGYTRYSNPMGLPELREAICTKLARENGIQVRSGEVMVTPGAKMALSLALASVLRPGDEVINILPCYPSYLPQILIAEPEAVIHNLDLRRENFSLDLDRLEQMLSPKVKALIINFPHNPTGHMLSRPELNGLGHLLAERDCWLISDEIYERLNFSGTRHLSPGSMPALAEQTITINGFSKTYSMTGWRIGYLVAKEPVMKIVNKLQQHLNTNVVPFIQKAALAALALPDSFLDDYNQRLLANAQRLAEIVAVTPALRLQPSEGGLFAFLDISQTGLDSDTFCSGLIERYMVAATPGIYFGPAWEDHIRISLVTDTVSFTEGVQRLQEYVGTLG
ncbi:MAG: aminotransferase class I/II-fold pyridoxal phosphate-dependent enzyme [Planctomycetes bacterium]|nr:aminotransferase class I/II-fold pyridoxal phosphate-dependent enzyme [Planctomycetota bacterium]